MMLITDIQLFNLPRYFMRETKSYISIDVGSGSNVTQTLAGTSPHWNDELLLPNASQLTVRLYYGTGFTKSLCLRGEFSCELVNPGESISTSNYVVEFTHPQSTSPSSLKKRKRVVRLKFACTSVPESTRFAPNMNFSFSRNISQIKLPYTFPNHSQTSQITLVDRPESQPPRPISPLEAPQRLDYTRNSLLPASDLHGFGYLAFPF